MEILLIVPSLDVPKWKGVSRYSLYLYETLKSYYNVDLLEAHSRDKNYLRAIVKSFLKGSFSNYKVIHATTPELGNFLNIFNAKKIVTFHDFIPFIENFLPIEFRAILLQLYKKSLFGTNVVIANSSTTKILLEKIFDKESTIVHPPVDTKKFKFKKKSLSSRKLILGFVSNFSFRKRVDIAIKACGILQNYVDCKLILAGGSLRRSLQSHFDVYQLLKEYKIRDYEVYEEINDNLLVKIYRRMHFLIFPSEIEGFGMPIIEAQACGTPVFTLKDSIIPPEVKETSIVAKNEVDIISKILKIYENKKLFKELQRKCLENSSKFGLSNFKDKILNIYNKLL